MIKRLFYLLIFTICPIIARAEELVVVVNKNNPVEQLTKSEVIDIFMGKYLAYPNGDFANPIELIDDNDLKELFYQSLIGRSLASVNAYWARLRFTGHKRPDNTLPTEEDVISVIHDKELAIGYIRLSKVTPNLKVVYTFNE